jgi:hypothetical protein
MSREIDIAWAAGFAEGEGCFGLYNGRPMVVMTQVDLWSMEKWAAIFPGTTIQLRPAVGNNSAYYRWHANGAKAIEVMVELREFMSPRRQAKIDEAVAEYLRRQVEREAKKNICPKGHVGQKYQRPGGGRICRVCVNERNARYREQMKAGS